MSRTARYKCVYFAIVLGGAALLLGLQYHFNWPTKTLLLVALPFLIPGRVLAFFWRDLLAGLRLLRARQFAQSKIRSQAFIDKVRAKPWLKRLIWLGTSSYSRDPESLALNNLGAAELALGNAAAAQAALQGSITVDPQNPLPYYNLALLSRARGDMTAAENYVAQAKVLGFSDSLSDAIVQASQSRFAATGGRP